MKKLQLLTCLILFSFGAAAQQWEKVFPPISGTYNQVTFINSSIGFIVGDDGGVGKTMDGGDTWVKQTNNGDGLLSSVNFINPTVGYAVGDVLYKSIDGGSSWSPVATCPVVNPQYVHFTSPDTGFVSNYSGIWRSIDAGVNWQYTTGTNSGDQLSSISFPGKDTGYVVGDYWKILRTINGGNTWTYQTAPTSPGYYDLKSCFFLNNDLGYAVGTNGVILKTINAGVNWNVITSGTIEQLNDIFFVSTSTGYIFGNNGLILKTTNGGTVWNVQTSGVTSGLNSGYFYSATTGIVVGNNGTILKTTNGGTNWTLLTPYIPVFNDVSAINPTDAFAVGDKGTIVKTQDNGSSWSYQNTGTTKTLNTTFFVSPTEGYAAGDSGTVLKTMNGGTTWSPLTTPFALNYYAMQFTAPNTGYITGGYVAPDTSQNLPGKVLKTTDAGLTWTTVLSVSGLEIKAVHFPTADTGYVVGGNTGNNYPKVYKTTDAGMTWTDQTANLSTWGDDFLSVYFVNGRVGYLSGTSGQLFKTVNGGTNWTYINSLGAISGDPINSLYFSNQNNGYAAFVGYVVNTTDGANSWGPQSSSSGVYNRFRSIDFSANQTAGYAVGTNGNIHRYVDTTMTQVWPGDADANNVVDNNDMLPLGLYYGQTGSARASVSNSWQAYIAANWTTLQTNGENVNHADCNGDGTINANDTLAINLNMSQTHAMATPGVQDRTSGNMYFTTSASSYLPGSWVDAELWIGTSANPISNLYGIAFDINFDAAQVQPGTASLIYPPSWLGAAGTNAISFSKINANTAYGALTRIDHLNANGYGKVATLHFQTRTNISSNTPMNFSVSGYQADDAAGAPVTFTTQPYSIAIDPNALGITATSNSASLNIYPNPYAGTTQIGYSLTEKSQVKIEVYNMLGQQIATLLNDVQPAGEYKVDFSARSLGYEAGIYYVKFIENGKASTRRIVEMK